MTFWVSTCNPQLKEACERMKVRGSQQEPKLIKYHGLWGGEVGLFDCVEDSNHSAWFSVLSVCFFDVCTYFHLF